MTSIESEIFTELYALLKEEYPSLFVTTEYTPTPDKFPCVFIEESDNYAVSLNGSNKGEVSAVMFEVNVFSNKQFGKKSECKAIIKSIDDYLSVRGFRRTMCSPMQNIDPAVYRITARYTASLYNDTIYRR